MQIGELARRSGASQKAVRLYDRLGLIVGARSPSNYRLFDEDAVGCVRGIRALQAAGVTRRDMRELGCNATSEDAARTLLRGKADEVLQRVDRELTELHQRRQRLLALRSDVDAYLQLTA
jgi:DNA-binding transcriptional MerR regulator